MRYFNFIFDLDGTLVDSFKDVKDSLVKAYKDNGVTDDVLVRETDLGPPIIDMIKKITPSVDPELADKIALRYRHFYVTEGYINTKLYPGVRETLTEIKRIGCKLFLATNKPYVQTRAIVKKLKIDMFDDVLCPDSQDGLKFSKIQMLDRIIKNFELKKYETVFVGDAYTDIFAAQHNNIDSIAVSYGYSDTDELFKSNPTYTIDKFSELQKFI
jgi:phosphoglycolate phosphatase